MSHDESTQAAKATKASKASKATKEEAHKGVDEEKIPITVDSDEELRKYLTPEEIACLDGMRGTNAGLCANYTDRFLLRFVCSRKNEVPRALELLKNYQEWRRMYNIDNFTQARVAEYVKQNMTIFHSSLKTRSGHPAVFVRASALPNLPRSPAGGLDIEGYMMFLAWWQDAIYAHGGLDCYRKGVVIFEDFSGTSMYKMMTAISRHDMNIIMSAVQDHCPGRFGAIRLYNAPWWIRFLMAIATPFMKKKMQTKLAVVDNEGIRKMIEPRLIPRNFGGEGMDVSDVTESMLRIHPNITDGTCAIVI